ncbi:hypothetical protein E2C01_090524 [Portunus trituberculatus]|uniref:Uncharacterized protein n=1 Tax=Portunus trituberculatus TaxID=210409 RepID=A0A5B7JQB9_PORTR|nr:hypothetical protein [Portunus trituberculatus]
MSALGLPTPPPGPAPWQGGFRRGRRDVLAKNAPQRAAIGVGAALARREEGSVTTWGHGSSDVDVAWR